MKIKTIKNSRNSLNFLFILKNALSYEEKEKWVYDGDQQNQSQVHQ
jgi:hypothetical protein